MKAVMVTVADGKAYDREFGTTGADAIKQGFTRKTEEVMATLRIGRLIVAAEIEKS